MIDAQRLAEIKGRCEAIKHDPVRPVDMVEFDCYAEEDLLYLLRLAYRCAALETMITRIRMLNGNCKCMGCAHITDEDEPACQHCADGDDSWEFDEERFATEEDATA